MPHVVRNVRHLDRVATLGPNGFVPYTATRDAPHRCGPSCSCRTRSAPTRPAVKQTSTTDAPINPRAKLEEIARKAVRASGSFRRMSDSIERLDSVVRRARDAADLRRAARQ